MACYMVLKGFHSRWMLQTMENDSERFISFFPEVDRILKAYVVYVIGHPDEIQKDRSEG